MLRACVREDTKTSFLTDFGGSWRISDAGVFSSEVMEKDDSAFRKNETRTFSDHIALSPVISRMTESS